MFYQEDWLIRQIKIIIDTVGRILRSKKMEKSELLEEEYGHISDRIDSLLDDGNINDAENYVYTNINQGDIEYLRLALDFYDRINRLTDEELEDANFSREEIHDGLREIIEIYGLSYFLMD